MSNISAMIAIGCSHKFSKYRVKIMGFPDFECVGRNLMSLLPSIRSYIEKNIIPDVNLRHLLVQTLSTSERRAIIKRYVNEDYSDVVFQEMLFTYEDEKESVSLTCSIDSKIHDKMCEHVSENNLNVGKFVEEAIDNYLLQTTNSADARLRIEKASHANSTNTEVILYKNGISYSAILLDWSTWNLLCNRPEYKQAIVRGVYAATNGSNLYKETNDADYDHIGLLYRMKNGGIGLAVQGDYLAYDRDKGILCIKLETKQK